MSRNYSKNIVAEFLDQTGTGNAYSDIEENCLTYDDYGALLRDCLSYFGGSGRWDDKAFELLEEMLAAIYEDVGGYEYFNSVR